VACRALTNKQTNKQTNIQTNKQTDKQTEATDILGEMKFHQVTNKQMKALEASDTWRNAQ
jgi:hypothetical protein